MTAKRNPAANCGNCPYWLLSIPEDNIGECHRDNPHAVDPYRRWETTNSKEWCGQHPDFWEQAEITNTCPSCWPASDDERAPEWTHVGAQSTTYCPHCGKATTSTFEQEKPRQ